MFTITMKVKIPHLKEVFLEVANLMEPLCWIRLCIIGMGGPVVLNVADTMCLRRRLSQEAPAAHFHRLKHYTVLQ